jgi:hemin uptake protein HemP
MNCILRVVIVNPNETNTDRDASELPPSKAEVVVDAQKLFEGKREICLVLDGVRYRLRITRRNKLILQK